MADDKQKTITLADLKQKMAVPSPAIITAKDKNPQRKNRKKDIWEILTLLEKDFPAIFNRENPKPLAIGIYKEIRLHYPDINMKSARIALGKWTKKPNYLNALINSGQRFHLDGSITQYISEKHKHVAADMLVDSKEEKQVS